MIPVVKMHGTHNDFVVIDERPPQVKSYADLARTVCDRALATGGADGLLVISDASGYTAEMRIFNADGSEAEMCGNGVRCVARYLAEHGAGERITLKTLAGPIEASVVAHAPDYLVQVDMGAPTFPEGEQMKLIEAAGRTWSYLMVSLGNPHIVTFVPDVDAIDLGQLGAELATHARFPGGTNVHVVDVRDGHELRVRHYERGVGLTQSCGTGAVACAAAALIERRCESPVTVQVPGGTLEVRWQRGAHALLTGPVVTVLEASVPA